MTGSLSAHFSRCAVEVEPGFLAGERRSVREEQKQREVKEWWGFVGPWGDPGPWGLECCCLRVAAREGGGAEGKWPRNIGATSFREQGWVRQTGTLAKPKYLTTFHFFSFSPNSLLEGLALKLFLFLMFQQYCSFNLVLGWNIDYLDYF